MVSGIRLHLFVKDITSSFASMVGVTGMLAAKIDFRAVLKNKRLYLITLMRMVVCPVIILVLLKIALLFINIENADYILLIVFLASMTPCAATLMQLAQIYNKEPEFAASLNISTTIVCIVTMPVLVMLYWL